MKILNENFTSQMKDLGKTMELGLSDYEYESYSNCLYVLYELTGKQFSFEQLFNTYDFFTDVLDGKRPDIDMFSHKEAYKGFYRLSKRYSTTKNLDEDQRKYLCFVIYQASCIGVFDEKKHNTTWNMDIFENGADKIITMFEDEKENFPEKYNVKAYSDFTKENYGYSVDNPIEVVSVSCEYEYLNVLETEDGKKISYERNGSLNGEDDIFVDEYEIYTNKFLGKKKIATLYITCNGIENSMRTPKGFKFIK